MMDLVNSSGWVEYLTRGPNGAFFCRFIQDTQNLLVPSISFYEVFDACWRPALKRPCRLSE